MEQVIYIEQSDKDEASRQSKSFALKETRSKAYINSLGAELAIKYLAQEDINISNLYNLHNINKIREEFEISDVMLPNIHIDARLVYDENLIFIPKSHFEYNIEPDIYMVFVSNEDTTTAKFLGYFEPKMINKNNQNEEYYFIEKEKLSDSSTIKQYVESFNGNNTQSLSDEETELGQKLALSFIDNDITNEDKKKLLSLLKKSAELREDLIEFDNFELVSYHTISTEDFTDPDIATSNKSEMENVDEFDVFDDSFDKNEELSDTVDTTTSTISDNMAQITEELIEPMGLVAEPILEENVTDKLIEDMTTTQEETLHNEIADEITSYTEIPVEDEVTEENTATGEDGDMENFGNIFDDESQNKSSFESNKLITNENIVPGEIKIDLKTPQTEFEEALNQENTLQIDDNLQATIDENSMQNNIIEEPIIEELQMEESLTEETKIDEPILEEVKMEEPILEESVSQDEELEDFLSMNDISQNTEVEEPIIEAETHEVVSDEITQEDDSKEIDLPEPSGKIEDLYKEETPIDDKTIETNTNKQEFGKKGVLAATAAVAVIASGLVFMSTQKSDNKMSEEIPENNAISEDLPALNENSIPEGNIQELQEQAIPQTPIQVTKDSNAKVETPTTSKAPVMNSPYLEVKKMSWSVPDYISYNDTFRKYLQTAGKSLKLSLSSDLLLATEYSYSNKVQVDIKFTKDGSVQNANIIQSSGSTQIDGIVLRTVKETLNVIKPPTDAVVGDSLHLALTIYM